MIKTTFRLWAGRALIAIACAISSVATASTVTVATWSDPWVDEGTSGPRPFSFTDTGTNNDGVGSLTASDDSILLDLPILGSLYSGLDASYVLTDSLDGPLETTSQTDVPVDPLNPSGPGYVSATFESGKVVITSDAVQGGVSGNEFASGDTLLTIEFQTAVAVLGNVFGVDDILTGTNVVFSGPALGSLVVDAEQFSFSIANLTDTTAVLKPADMEDWEASASFTSSATVIPLPPAVWLFGAGLIGLVGVARRRQV